MIDAMASRLGTGSVPGWPRQTGQTLVLGSSPNPLRQPQNILVRVESSTWHSNPMTVSSSAMTRGSLSKTAHGASTGGAYHRWMPEPVRTASPEHAAPTSLIWAALGAVYVIWSTTYLAIKVVNETLPTLLATSVRFLVAGAVLYGIADPARRSRRRPADPTELACGDDRGGAAVRLRQRRRRVGGADDPERTRRLGDRHGTALDGRHRPDRLPSSASAARGRRARARVRGRRDPGCGVDLGACGHHGPARRHRRIDRVGERLAVPTAGAAPPSHVRGGRHADARRRRDPADPQRRHR